MDPFRPVWSPNPLLSVRTNWLSYRAAALASGRRPSPEEFAQLWWVGDPSTLGRRDNVMWLRGAE